MTAKYYKALREVLGSQEEIAARLDVSIRTLQHREHGKRKIDREAECAIHCLHALIHFGEIFQLTPAQSRDGRRKVRPKPDGSERLGRRLLKGDSSPPPSFSPGAAATS